MIFKLLFWSVLDGPNAAETVFSVQSHMELQMYLLRMKGVKYFVFNKINEYLVFKFQRFIELDFEIEYKVSKLVFLE